MICRPELLRSFFHLSLYNFQFSPTGINWSVQASRNVTYDLPICVLV